MVHRFKIGRKMLFEMYDRILVHCPKCDERATIIKDPHEIDQKRLTCTKCSYVKKGSLPLHSYFPKLWLRISCGKNELWAINEEHLEYIKDYVEAKLRERAPDPIHGWSNQSLASRLPKWIKSAKNRDKVLKCIKKLEDKL